MTLRQAIDWSKHIEVCYGRYLTPFKRNGTPFGYGARYYLQGYTACKGEGGLWK